jgi:hypothetical protein
MAFGCSAVKRLPGEAKGAAKITASRFGGDPMITARSTWKFVACLRCGRKTTKYCGRAATLRQPLRGFDFDPPLRFLLRDEAGNMITPAVGPRNSDVPSTRRFQRARFKRGF